MNVFIVGFFCLLLGCSGGSFNAGNNPDDKSKRSALQASNELKKAYNQLSHSSDEIHHQKYFDAFPRTFEMFNAVFGYSDQGSDGTDFSPGPLYDKAHLYVEAFFNLQIDKTDLYDKIIRISINGRWYADGVNHFQKGVLQNLKNDPELFARLLANYDNDQIKSFWIFCFDGPHPPSSLPSELDKIKEKNRTMYDIAKQALYEVNKK